MEEFKKKYKEEAQDLLNDLEKALLLLEATPTEKNLIEQVFRVMHSLKGGGAMFGFDKISEFTHHLESVYDLVRSGQMELSKELFNVTLHSVDHLKLLLNEDEYSQELLSANIELTKNVITIIEQQNLRAANDNDSSAANKELPKKTNQKYSTYFISFTPFDDIFDNGTNPLYLLDELCLYGEHVVLAKTEKIPVFTEFDTTKCYVAWEVYLATYEDINALKDVFIFVEDECKLEVRKVSDDNLLKNKIFVKELRSKTTYETVVNSEIADNKQTQQKKIEQQKTAPKKTEHHIDDKVSNQAVQKARQEISKITQKNTPQQRENIIASIRVASDKLDKLMNLVSELVTTQASLTLFAEEHQLPGLVSITENVENISRQLRDVAFSISLIPLETLLTRFQRLVRDLAGELDRKAELVTEGIDTELDKNLIQVLNEPLMHIIRNSIDHGIESEAERRKKNKPEVGQILLKSFYSGAYVHIVVKDDGRGINPADIREKAIAKGFINAETTYTDKDLLNMIFLPGLSTAKFVSEISGRGVGMDVVKRKINEVRGEVEIDSTIGAGTAITIKLPLTLSIIDGLLVRIHETNFIIPLSAVDKIYPVEHAKVENTFNNLLQLDSDQVPFHYLREAFGLVGKIQHTEEVVVVKYEDKRVGLVVDVVVGEYQAVLKPLGKMYKEQEMISGASILGDGTVALVMDTNKIIKVLSNEL